MKIEHFDGFVQECQKIQRAFDFLPDFCVDGVFAAWELGGIFCPDWSSQNHEPQFTEQHLTRWWVNVAAHMSVAAVFGLTIASAVMGTESYEARRIIEALLIHDWNKRQDIACIQRGYNIRKLYLSTLKDNKRLAKWFSSTVVNLAGVAGHGGIAITEERQLTVSEQIVFYADMCTRGSAITPYAQRLAELQSRMGPGGIYEDSEAYFQKKYAMSYREKHDAILRPIEEEFAKRAGWTGSQEMLPLFLAPKELCA